MAAGLGRVELEFATSLTALLFWIMCDGDRQYRLRNGSFRGCYRPWRVLVEPPPKS